MNRSRETSKEGTINGEEDLFFDAKSNSDPSSIGQYESKGKYSPQDNEDSLQLKNFEGISLAPGSTGTSGKLGTSSSRNSFVSSISSLSEENSSDAIKRVFDEDNSSTSLSNATGTQGNEYEYPPSDLMPPANNKPTLKTSSEKLSLNEESILFSEFFGLHDNSLANKYFQTKIKVSSNKFSKNQEELFKGNVRFVQEVKHHTGPIWTMKFSPNGMYLASGGQDTRVLVWSICKLPQSTEDEYDKEEFNPQAFEYDGLSSEYSLRPFDFLYSEPYRVFEGHSGDVIDISWSRSNFLLSASTDKTVRLWHVTKNDCLQFFRHPDIVTCIEFHPLHDRYFVSGCFDRRIRIWDIIPDGNVREWASTPDTITSLAISPDGSTVASGLIQGQIYFYEYDGMKYKTQMDCRNRAGKYKKGSKVTGMSFFARKDQPTTSNAAGSSDNPNNSYPPRRKNAYTVPMQLLVSTNDSRVRLCRLEDYSMLCKYKGLSNKSMQIKANFSDDYQYIISGSETGNVFIWKTNEDLPSSSSFSFLFASSSTSTMNTSAHNNGTSPNTNHNQHYKNKYYESFDINTLQHSSKEISAISAIFAPPDSIKYFLRANKQYLSIIHQEYANAANPLPPPPPSTSAPTTRGSLTNPPAAAPANTTHRSSAYKLKLINGSLGLDFNCRIIATADSDGAIKIFFRLS